MTNRNPYDVANVDDHPEFLGTWRDEELVVVSHNGVLPDRCIGCNKPANHWFQQRIYYDESTVKNMPRQERPLRIFVPTFVAIVGWLLGIALTTVFVSVKDYPASFCVTVVVLLMLAVWLVGLFLRGVHAESPVRFGLCKPCHVLRWVGNTTTLVAMCGLYVCMILIDFRDTGWVKLPQLLRLSFVIGTLFAIGLVLRSIQIFNYHPVLAREDKAKRLWVKGLSKPFRESLPEWQPTTERSPILPEPNA